MTWEIHKFCITLAINNRDVECVDVEGKKTYQYVLSIIMECALMFFFFFFFLFFQLALIIHTIRDDQKCNTDVLFQSIDILTALFLKMFHRKFGCFHYFCEQRKSDLSG